MSLMILLLLTDSCEDLVLSRRDSDIYLKLERNTHFPKFGKAY